jgi:hypothetical protein
VFVSAALELGGGRSLWWLQETLGIVLFLDPLGFYLQIQDNHFIPVCLLVSTCVAYCNWIFD